EIPFSTRLLTKFCQRLRQEGGKFKSGDSTSSSSNEDSGIEWSEEDELRLGNLNLVVTDLKGIIQGLLRKNKGSSNEACCPSCEAQRQMMRSVDWRHSSI
ncbi:Uncharacterized protein FKW44_016553, partial [Caligus rogercresseyi]